MTAQGYWYPPKLVRRVLGGATEDNRVLLTDEPRYYVLVQDRNRFRFF